MSKLFRIRSASDFPRVVFRFVFKCKAEYGSGFRNLRDWRIALGCDHKLNAAEIEKATLAAVDFFDLTGECEVFVFDDTHADPDDAEMLAAIVTRDYFEREPGCIRAYPVVKFDVLSQSESI